MPHSVLITGGAGFIGSALSRRLVNAGYDVAVMDILHPQVHAKGRAITLPPSVRLFTGDVTHAPDWDAVLRLFTPSQIVHLAAETGTAQSLSEASRHGSVNVLGTTQMLDALSRAGLVPDQFVLASSRAVYGEGAWRYGDEIFYPPPRSHAQLVAGQWDPRGPAGERAVPLPSSAARTEPRPTNIYGATKLAIDHAITSYAAAHGLAATSLRYFNVAGAYAGLGERHATETHLIPLVLQVALGLREEISVFGDDWPTPDGTCIRDYIHVRDLADAHVLALATAQPGAHGIYNLGNGTGFSVREVIACCERVTGGPIAARDVERRAGDPAVLIASSEKAITELGWRPRHTSIDEIVADAWEFTRSRA